MYTVFIQAAHTMEEFQAYYPLFEGAVEAGEIGICLYDGNAYLKQLVALEHSMALHSLNPAYSDIVVSPELPLRVLGKVVR